MTLPRESGIVLHITSLPGAYGIGDLGESAFKFVDQLHKMGQKLWQVLPLGPTTYGDSPYQCLSTFAGNTLLLDLATLVKEGILDKELLDAYPQMDQEKVDYGYVYHERSKLYPKMTTAFPKRASQQILDQFETFQKEHAFWLDDYALFIAIKNDQEGKPWYQWPQALASRDPETLALAKQDLADSIYGEKVLQFLFDRQWHALKKHCAKRGVRLIGDVPIFVAGDSADVWANQSLFYLDEAGQATVVAGVPPDYFSETGQLWGNPLYRWTLMAEDEYSWWMTRLKRVYDWVDIVRIDHFRGFESYWEIPAGEETAINGQWVKGPGIDFFNAIKKHLGDRPIIAEDLGIITEEVEQLRDETQLPGMKVLHFGFCDDELHDHHRPENFPENAVCYTGTHDNNTTVGWFQDLKDQDPNHREIQRWLDYLESDGSEIHRDLIRAAMNSNANTVLFPLQDLLGLGPEARLNLPGSSEANWQWRFTFDQITEEMASWLKSLTQQSKRNKNGLALTTTPKISTQ